MNQPKPKKITIHTEKKIEIDVPKDLNELKKIFIKEFNVDEKSEFWLSYQDEENENIVITNEEDFKAFLESFQNNKINQIKASVNPFQGIIEGNRPKENPVDLLKKKTELQTEIFENNEENNLNDNNLNNNLLEENKNYKNEIKTLTEENEKNKLKIKELEEEKKKIMDENEKYKLKIKKLEDAEPKGNNEENSKIVNPLNELSKKTILETKIDNNENDNNLKKEFEKEKNNLLNEIEKYKNKIETLTNENEMNKKKIKELEEKVKNNDEPKENPIDLLKKETVLGTEILENNNEGDSKIVNPLHEFEKKTNLETNIDNNNENEKNKLKIKELEDEIKKLLDENENNKKKIKELDDKNKIIDENEKKIKKLEDDKNKIIDENEKKIKKLKDENEVYKKQEQNVRIYLDNKNDEKIKELEKQLEEEKNKRDKEIGNLKDKIKKLEEEGKKKDDIINERKSKIEEINREHPNSDENIQEISSKLEKLETENSNLNNEIKKKNEEIKKLMKCGKKYTDALDKNMQLFDEIKNLEKEIAEYKKKIKEYEEKINNNDNKKEYVSVNSSIHEGIKCEKCKICPIIGERYKCSVCPNYNLCSKCEEKNFDLNEHPHDFIRMRKVEKIEKKNANDKDNSIDFLKDFTFSNDLGTNVYLVYCKIKKYKIRFKVMNTSNKQYPEGIHVEIDKKSSLLPTMKENKLNPLKPNESHKISLSYDKLSSLKASTYYTYINFTFNNKIIGDQIKICIKFLEPTDYELADDFIKKYPFYEFNNKEIIVKNLIANNCNFELALNAIMENQNPNKKKK